MFKVLCLLIMCNALALAKAKTEELVDAELLESITYLQDEINEQQIKKKLDNNPYGEDEIEKELEKELEDQEVSNRVLAEKTILPIDEKSEEVVVPQIPMNGFKRTKKLCAILSEPIRGSQNLGDLRAGKKIWTDTVDIEWLKVYLRKGVGFIAADCVRAPQKISQNK